MNHSIDEEHADWTCPICGVSCYGTGGCEHHALHRYDDGDGDAIGARGPFSSDSVEVTTAFDELYEAVLYHSMIWLAGSNEVRMLLNQQVDLLDGEVSKLGWVTAPLKAVSIDGSENQDFEDLLPSDFYSRLTSWFRDMFTLIWRRQPTSVLDNDYLITHSPGLSWSGTHYWATTGKGCLPAICSEIAAITAEVRKVSELARDRLEKTTTAQTTIEKVDAWLEYYRRRA